MQIEEIFSFVLLIGSIGMLIVFGLTYVISSLYSGMLMLLMSFVMRVFTDIDMSEKVDKQIKNKKVIEG